MYCVRAVVFSGLNFWNIQGCKQCLCDWLKDWKKGAKQAEFISVYLSPVILLGFHWQYLVMSKIERGYINLNIVGMKMMSSSYDVFAIWPKCIFLQQYWNCGCINWDWDQMLPSRMYTYVCIHIRAFIGYCNSLLKIPDPVNQNNPFLYLTLTQLHCIMILLRFAAQNRLNILLTSSFPVYNLTQM